jgi:hypothetical protein
MCLQARGTAALQAPETLWIAVYYPQPAGPPREYFLESKASFEDDHTWFADNVYVGSPELTGPNNDIGRTLAVVAFIVKDKALDQKYTDLLKADKTRITRLPSSRARIEARVIRTASRGCRS